MHTQRMGAQQDKSVKKFFPAISEIARNDIVFAGAGFFALCVGLDLLAVQNQGTKNETSFDADCLRQCTNGSLRFHR